MPLLRRKAEPFFFPYRKTHIFCLTILFIFVLQITSAQVAVPGKAATPSDTLTSRKGALLKQVEVVGKKPIIQMEIDRLRFNVSGTDLVFGNNIWNVIEKTPLVTASSDGNIQISGTTGAVVYINNKRKMLSGNALKTYLSAIPADNLEAIEVITTPSSKYDAEGGAGILNIITKKRKDEGLDGNVALTVRQTAINSQSGSVFLNGRKGKWDVYSNLYLVNRRRAPESWQDIDFPPAGSGTLTNRHIGSSGQNRSLSSGANMGIDYQLSKNHVMGLLFDYAGNNDKKNRDALTTEHWQGFDSVTSSGNTDKLNSQTWSLNVNYEGRLDSSGKKLSADLDVLHYASGNNSISRTDVLDAGNFKPMSIQDYFRSASPQQVSNQSAKIDFEWPVSKKIALGFGAKASFSQLNNNLLFENYTGNDTWVKDVNRSNLFKYDENINAAYAILNHKVNAKWSYQLGARLENTIAKGDLEGTRVVDRNYVNAFPTAFLKYAPSKQKSYGLSFSGRITRPDYWDVNPFRTYTTDKAYFEGNPFLLPSKYYREELSHILYSKKATYTFQLAASQTLDEFHAVPYKDTANIIVNKKTNYGNKYAYTAAAIYYNQLYPWWQLSATILTGYVLSKGNYAAIAIDNKSFLLSLSANQTFTISKKQHISCNVIANNTLPFTVVNTHVGDRLDTEIRIRKAAGPFNFTLSVTDLFKSNKDIYIIHADDLTLRQNYYNDTRSVAFILSYNFGKSTVKKQRDRDTEFQNVKSRIMG